MGSWISKQDVHQCLKVNKVRQKCHVNCVGWVRRHLKNIKWLNFSTLSRQTSSQSAVSRVSENRVMASSQEGKKNLPVQDSLILKVRMIPEQRMNEDDYMFYVGPIRVSWMKHEEEMKRIKCFKLALYESHERSMKKKWRWFNVLSWPCTSLMKDSWRRNEKD